MSDLDEDDFNPRAHTTLLQAISGLKKTQHIRKSTRNEPRIKQDEFELAKGTTVAASSEDATPAPIAVGVNDLVKVLHKKKKHLDASKLLKNVHRTKKVFKKPLEKPAAERIKRQIGYDKVKSKLRRWDAIVAKNRSSETQVFPLASETIFVNTSLNSKPLENTIKSDLRREMEAAEEKLRQLKRQREGDFEDEATLEKRQQELHNIQLTREELIARRKELAYLKMRESQQSARARMRNKIKSKKYHKLLRRQKLQAQLKEFEQLQKTNPEAALEKLNELEKSRVRERATLRHKNTGVWAKSLQVRAKYDKDVRKDLAEQLQISRELTLKTKVNNDDSDQSDGEELSDRMGGQTARTELEERNDTICDDLMNPWITMTTGKSTLADKNSSKESDENWRKYWMERNRNEKLLDAYKNNLNEAMSQKENMHDDVEAEEEKEELKEDLKKTSKSDAREVKKKKKLNPKKKNQKKKSPPHYENGWLVEEIDTDENTEALPDIDDLFDEMEDKIEERVREKLHKFNEEAKRMSMQQKRSKLSAQNQLSQKDRDELKNLKDLTFKENATYPALDEELGNENAEMKTNLENSVTTTTTKTINQQETKVVTAAADSTTSGNIDPTKFPTVTMKQPHLNAVTSAIDDDDGIDINEDEDEDPSQHQHQMTISEAFEDDDIVADFGEEKAKDSELKNTEIELSMPGWGSWAGAGIDESTARKPKKRIVLKLAPEEKRRDENKDAVYINEETTKQVRPHLVSDLPFPFTSLQDYEASIRAPIGRNFVPETAFRMLTRPSVITRKGAIIEPMDEKELTKKPRRPKNVVDGRIKRREMTLNEKIEK